MPYTGNKCTKNSVLFFPKHFHGGGFNFHGMNAQSYVVDMIFSYFACVESLCKPILLK